MSFGWSAGDIVAALKLLHQIGSALRDSGGASSDFQNTLLFLQTLSRTLEHLNALQATGLDLEVADNLRQQCDHIRLPLAAFLDDVGGRFKSSLGPNSVRNNILSAPRKVQWALSTSKKTKRLQDRIAVPMASVGLVLGQQILLATLKIPQDIQDRISHTIDTSIETRILPETTLVNRKIEALLEAQVSSVDTITRSLQDIGRLTAEAIHKKTIEDRESNAKLESHRGKSLQSYKPPSDPHLTTTNPVIQICKSARVGNSNLLCRHPWGHNQPLSLRKKLNLVDSSLGAIESSLKGLSTASSRLDTADSKSEIELATRNILYCVWLLLLNLQLLIRELLTLLAPYLIALYRTSIQGLLQDSDHFMFEDSIGRIKRLPCAQFQHWNVFYDFLADSFQDAPGLGLVLAQRFKVINGYNDFPITREAWRAAIQPKAKITMAMLVLNSNVARRGKCADPCCSGKVSFTGASPAGICPVCRKYIYLITEANPSITTRRGENTALKESLKPVLIPIKSKFHPIWNATSKEISAFKRVIPSDQEFLERAAARKRARSSYRGGDRDSMRSTVNEYFVPKQGIDQAFITAYIDRYLGNGATVQPGTYFFPETKKTVQWYYITSYGKLTTAMITDLQADSERWEADPQRLPKSIFL